MGLATIDPHSHKAQTKLYHKGARKGRRRKKKTKPQMLRPDKQAKKLDGQRKTRLTLGYSQGD